MPFHPIPDIVQVTTVFQFGGDEMVNVWYVDHPAPGDPLTQVAAAQLDSRFVDFFTTVAPGAPNSVMAFMPTELLFARTEVRDMVEETRPTYEFPHDFLGENISDTSPTQLVVVCALKTALRGRSFRGSKKLGPVSRSEISGTTGTVSAGFIDSLDAAYAALLTGLDADSTELMVVSQFSGKDAQGNPLRRPVPISTPVTEVLVRPRYGTLQSRKLDG